MSDLVREFFPEAPERCQECPGLEYAALEIAERFRLAAAAGMTAIGIADQNAENLPGYAKQYPLIARAFTGLVIENLTKARDIANRVTSKCETGVITTPAEMPKRRRQKAETINRSYGHCGSRAVEAMFFGTSVRIAPAIVRDK